MWDPSISTAMNLLIWLIVAAVVFSAIVIVLWSIKQILRLFRDIDILLTMHAQRRRRR